MHRVSSHTAMKQFVKVTMEFLIVKTHRKEELFSSVAWHNVYNYRLLD